MVEISFWATIRASSVITATNQSFVSISKRISWLDEQEYVGLLFSRGIRPLIFMVLLHSMDVASNTSHRTVAIKNKYPAIFSISRRRICF
jgi:hypothetical protein